MTVPRCKGSVILDVKRALRRDYGDDAFQRILAACEPATREVIGGIVLATEFYPEALFGDLILATERVVGRDKFPEYTREIAKSQVNGVLKFLLRFFVSPKKLSENNHKLWKALHDTGTLTVSHGADDRSHTVVIEGFTFPNTTYEKMFVEFHCAVIELTGARNVTGVSTKAGPATYVQKYHWEY